MSNTREFTCIVCPNGCSITAEYDEAGVISVSGNRCPRGAEYVRQEIVSPMRTVTTTIPVDGGELPLCSVRLTAPIPKAEIFKAVAEIQKQRLTAPTKVGQVVIRNLLGYESDVIVTKSIRALSEL